MFIIQDCEDVLGVCNTFDEAFEYVFKNVRGGIGGTFIMEFDDLSTNTKGVLEDVKRIWDSKELEEMKGDKYEFH